VYKTSLIIYLCNVIVSIEAWKSVTERVQDARLSAHMKPVSFIGIDGLQMCGLTHPAVVYLLEQLPGAQYLRNYKFKHHETQYIGDMVVLCFISMSINCYCEKCFSCV